jgi:hypothetical protein
LGIKPFHSNAINAMRNGGYEFRDALCELIDNSIWHGQAKNIQINLSWDPESIGKMRFSEVFVTDNGKGMSSDTLADAVRIGYGTANAGDGNFGRFGYGMIAGALTQCRFIEIYSKHNGDWNFIRYDINKVGNGEDIPDPIKKTPPEKYSSIIDGSGTIVIWTGFDLATPFNDDLETFNAKGQKKGHLGLLHYNLGRIYRKQIADEVVGTKDGNTAVLDNENKITITINGGKLTPHDPLYMTKIPGFESDPKPSEIFEEITIDVPTHPKDQERHGKDSDKVTLRMTILNEKWRRHNENKQNEAGSDIYDRFIHWNKGISILRMGREIIFDNVAGLGPRFEYIDRYWGCEIDFPDTLDERFKIKNVKVGLKPDEDLLNQLDAYISPAIAAARKEISSILKQSSVDAEEEANVGPHGAAEERFSETNTGTDVQSEPISEAEQNQIVAEIAEKARKKNLNFDPEKLLEVGVKIFDDADLPENGPFIEVKNKLGNNLLFLNLKHPFFIHHGDIFAKIDELSDPGKIESDLDLEMDPKMMEYRRNFLIEIDKARYLLDLLLGSFASAKGSMEVISERQQTVGSTLNTLISRWTQAIYTVANDKNFDSRVSERPDD